MIAQVPSGWRDEMSLARPRCLPYVPESLAASLEVILRVPLHRLNPESTRSLPSGEASSSMSFNLRNNSYLRPRF